MMRFDKRMMAAAAFAVMLGAGVAAYADDSGGPGKATPFNDVPYSKLAAMSPAERMKAAQDAMAAGTLLMGGMPTKGPQAKTVALTGELVDTDCYSSMGYRGHNHAMCARVCVLNGSPLTFVSSTGAAYAVQGQADAQPVSPTVLDSIALAAPISITGYVNERGGQRVLTIETIGGKAVEPPHSAM